VEILRQAANIFPSGNVPVDFDERTEVFESLPEEKVEDELSALDDQWYAGDDEFLPTLARYVHKPPGGVLSLRLLVPFRP
jgi:hypothetical protein